MNVPSSVTTPVISRAHSQLPLPKIDPGLYKNSEKQIPANQFKTIESSLIKNDGVYVLNRPIWSFTSDIWKIVGLVYFVSSPDGEPENLVFLYFNPLVSCSDQYCCLLCML